MPFGIHFGKAMCTAKGLVAIDNPLYLSGNPKKFPVFFHDREDNRWYIRVVGIEISCRAYSKYPTDRIGSISWALMAKTS